MAVKKVSPWEVRVLSPNVSLGLRKSRERADFLRAVHQQKLRIHSAARLALQALCFFDLHFIPAPRLSSSSLGSWKEVDLRRRPLCGCGCGGARLTL